jgi:hypothetical protein
MPIALLQTIEMWPDAGLAVPADESYGFGCTF